MSYQVTTEALGNLTLNEADPIASVLQNVAIILSTRQGSIPLYRSFGLPQKFLDKPIPVAKPMLYAEIKEAVEEFEPRAEVLSVTFQEDAAFSGKMRPIVEVEIINA